MSKLLHPVAFSIYGIVVMLLVVAVLPLQKTAFQSFFANVTQTGIIAEVNPARQEAELLPVGTSEKLTQAAQMKAEDMIARGYFSHTGPGGETPWSWLDKAGYKYALAGENLAKNYYDSELLVKAWLNSPSHAKNILGGYYTDVGIGVATGEVNGEETTMVVMFVGREITPTIQTLSNLPQAPPPAPQEPKSAPEPQTNLAVAPPEELATVLVVEEEVLEKEKGLVLASSQPLDFRGQDTGRAMGALAFIINFLPGILKISLTVFFAFVSGLAVYVARKRQASYFGFTAPRLLTLILFVSVLWM
ncbi:MAG: CAP domain-containing protein [Candidatus Spechtbacterales bacterium]